MLTKRAADPAEVRVKFCGMRRHEDVDAAIRAGASYVAFNFVAASPRFVEPSVARALALEVPAGIVKVGLVADADDVELDKIIAEVPLDMWQLHGQETPDRVVQLRDRYGLPVMKAIGMSTADDLAQIDKYEDVADQLLIDAKAPRGANISGGNGVAFDWSLLRGRKYWRRPWMLAGGLTSRNVAEAVAITGARQVDVSSGIEREKGVKDPDLMAEFVQALTQNAAN